MLLVNEERFFLKEWPELLALRVNVPHGIICPVLAGILSRELESVSSAAHQWECVMHEIDIAGGPLLVVLDEAVMEVTTREVIGGVLVEAYSESSM